MQKPKKNGLEVKEDEDPQTVGDWLRDLGTAMGINERKFTRRMEVCTNEAMEIEILKICKAEGGISFGEATRKLWREKIARFNMRKEESVRGDSKKY